ncbi:MAG: hypothetical protein JRN52_00130 [Nitrososphaerota archaeon]|nr:hypothetical protein [Nitrososphaerota archaeon]
MSTWPIWDQGIEWISLYGDFIKGSSGNIKPTGQDELPYRLTEVVPDHGFTDETAIPWAGVTIRFVHSLEAIEGGKTRLTHHVSIFGPGAESLGPEIGPGITSGIPETMNSIANLARSMDELIFHYRNSGKQA